MVRAAALALLALSLAACARSGPPEGVAYVEISVTGGRDGADVLRIHHDDRIWSLTGGRERLEPAVPGTFVTVAALVAADGPGVVARMEQEDAPCEGAGIAAVRAVPAIGGFAGAEASCPDPVLATFMDELRAAIGRP